MNRAITDTGPPVHLCQISQCQLLGMFKSISLSEQVKKELELYGSWEELNKNKSIHINKESVSEDEIENEQLKWEKFCLQRADLSVLVIVHRLGDALALTDDLELRKAIESLDRTVVGSVGVLIRGYRTGKLKKDELCKCVDMLFNDSSLYLSSAFRARVLSMIENIERK